MSHAEHVNGELPHEPEKATLEGRNKVLGFWLFLGGSRALRYVVCNVPGLRGQNNEGPTAAGCSRCRLQRQR